VYYFFDLKMFLNEEVNRCLEMRSFVHYGGCWLFIKLEGEVELRFSKSLGLLALMLTAGPAAADQIKTFTLTIDGCSGGTACGTGPFATITLDQVNSTTILVTETLLGGDHYAGTGAGAALAFNISGVSGTTSITNISDTADFAAVANVHASQFGTMGLGVKCTSCQGSNSTLNSVSFDVTNLNGITLNNFISNGNAYFTTDIAVGTNTGNVGTNTDGILSGTPEPATVFSLGLGLVGLGLFPRWLKRRS
jgi:hypothetical protein